MAHMTKEFAENLLKRVQSGKHINTTVWEEEQLIRGWLQYHDLIFKPRLDSLLRTSAAAPTAAPVDNTGDMLMAGAVGYMTGSLGSHHEAPSHHSEDFHGGGGLSGGAGASASWDDSSSNSSSSDSSSDSSSSYDNGASDSGSSSSGGSD